MGDNYIFNSKVLLKITNMVKETDEDGNETVRAINEKFETVKGRDLWSSYLQNKEAHPIVKVYEQPHEFNFGVVYALANGKRAWIFNLKEE